MTKVSAQQPVEAEIDEARVIRYLQENPALLMNYPDILSTLSIPHQTGGATSFFA